MGFDNECILNIQSLAGEYFCPVCRLLVYPNEALQSLCTHLYCKPCLTYIVSTTRACPYDGYLVTEADSKPLTESNKALAETIGKVSVHCLYHRSGCTWQGTLSDCMGHSSGCAFGNSAVVCNRCGIQIVHRQVQEHAQNCPGVPQAQQAGSVQVAATTTSTTGDQTLSASQTETTTTRAETPQSTTIPAPGQAPSQLANLNSQALVTAAVAAVTSDQWYQQQYQQYYQQYSSYDAYYQQYYPYQQQAVPQLPQQNLQIHGPPAAGQPQVYAQSQHQPQPQVQPQVQPQAQPLPQPQPQPQPQQQSHVQPQSYLSAQTNVAAQSQSLIHINQHQQPDLVVLPHSQISSQIQTQPLAQGHPSTQVQAQPQAQPQPQNVQMPQFPLLQSQMQQPQPQILQQPQTQLHSQALPQSHVQPQSQPPSHLPASQPNQLWNTSLPSQHPSAHAVTGHQSYPQPQPRQQMQLVGMQQPMHVHPQGGVHSQSQPHGQIQSSHPPQHPQMHSLQSHPTTANQPHPPLLPSQGTVLQQQVHPNVYQPGLPVHQQTVLLPAPSATPQQYVQQPPPSGQPVVSVPNQMSQAVPFVQQQLPVQSHVRPLGTTHSLQQHAHPYLQAGPNVASSHAMHPHPSQYVITRPSMPNHGVQSHPFTQSATGIQVKPRQLPANQPPMLLMSEAPGDKVADKHVVRIEGDYSHIRITNKDESDAGVKSEVDMKPIDEKAVGEVGDKSSGVDTSAKDISESSKTVKTETDSHIVGDSMNKKAAEEEIIEEQKDVSLVNHRKIENSVSEGKEINGDSFMRAPLLHDAEKSEEHGRKLHHDKVLPHGQVTPKGHGPSDFKGSHSNQERQKHLPSHYISNSPQPRPPAPGMFQGPPSGLPLHAQAPGLPPPQLRPQGPGHAALPENLPPGPYGMGPSNYGPHGPLSQGPNSGTPRMSQGESIGRPPLGMPHLTSFDSRGAPPYGSDPGMNSNNFSRLNGAPGFDSASSYSFRNGRLNPVQDEQLDSFPLNSGRRIGDQGQVDGDLKQFPRLPHLDAEPVPKFGSYFSSSSLDKGPHGPNFDPSVDSGFSRFVPPYHSAGRYPDDDAGERRVGLRDDSIGRRDFLRPVPGFGRHYMDGFASRSPGGDYPGMSAQFGGHPGDGFDGREPRFGDRFPGLHRAEFEGPDNFHMAELIGRDLPSSHLRRGDFLESRNLPSHLRFREPDDFGPFSGHEWRGEFARPGDIRHPRSSFSLPGFSNDSRVYGGDMDSFENMRKRNPTSMGWCRICKVDCETVEGLDMHSQTREHQKMAMDMVASIKQNSKKQKLNSSDRSVSNVAKKSRNTSFEGHGNKH